MSAKTLSSTALKRAWESKHQEQFPVRQPEQGVVDFVQFLPHQLPLNALDAGCGRGRNANYLSQQGFKVFGCDLSWLAIKIAKSRIPQQTKTIFYQVSDLTHLPYPDNCFGAAICVHVLPYHLKADLCASIDELWRVLRPGGWLYLDLLDCEDAEYGIGPELEKNTFLDEGGVPIHFSFEQEISGLMSKFRIQQQSRLKQGSSSRIRLVWEVWATKQETFTVAALPISAVKSDKVWDEKDF